MLNLHHLKYFRDAAQGRSIVASARINRVSHSAVSQAIRGLEEQLGLPLLRHAKRRFELTSQGAHLFQRTHEIFHALEKTLSSVRGGTDAIEGPLALGFSHSIGLSFLAAPFGAFFRKNPGVSPVIRIGNSAGLERLLRSGEIELGFGIEDESFARCERVELHRGSFVLAARPGAAPARYLVGDKGLEVARLRAAIRSREPKAEFVEVQSWELIVSLAREGVGAGLVPDYLLPPDRLLGLRLIGIRGLPRYRLCAFFRSAETLSPAARALLSRCGRQARR